MPAPHLPAAAREDLSTEDHVSTVDRRQSGRRARARDRLMDRATRSYPKNESLAGTEDIENLLLFIDDDLREAAVAMGKVEGYLVQTLGLLEQSAIDRESVQSLARDADVLEHLDMLGETVESLRRRLARLSLKLK